MKRIVGRFEEEDDAERAEEALRAAGLEPERPAFDNPFFDPAARVPEARGLAAGAILGGLIGLALFQAINVGLLWVPRVSPVMSAGEYAIPVLGFGLGVAVGGFVGGVVGTLRPIADTAESEVAVEAPDDRIGETADVMRAHDATNVSGAVTYHENPEQVSP